MSNSFPGGLIRKTPVTPSPTSAPGMWTLAEASYWVKQGLWPDANADLQWPYVAMLLSTTAVNGAQNNTFLDSSSNNFTITRNGNTTQGSASPYNSLWSNFFDGSGDYLTVASNAAFGMGTGDFTIECWVNPTAFTGSGNVLIDMRSGAEPSVRPDLEYNSSGVLNYRVNGSTVISGGTLVIGNWSHVALARSGTTTKLFLNGVQVGSSYADSNDYGSSAACRIGADDDGSPNAYVNGYMSNVRVVKGTAVYTANFTPPTVPLTAISGTSLLTCQSNRFIDNSSNAFAITVNGNTSVSRFSPFSPASAYSTTANGGSAYFDGSGDYLNTGSNAAFAFGTGDYTLECWVYATSTPSDMGIYEGRSGGAASDGFTLTAFSASVIRIYSGGVVVASSGTNYVGTWAHVAVTRSSGTTTLWINGVSQGTSSTSYNCTNTDAVVGGGRYSSGSSVNTYFPGYISNFRIVKGTAVYTANFTPPTAPVTAISGTSLLLNATNAAIFDNAMINDLETVGNAQVSTVQSKFGGSSMYFDGTGDYLATQGLSANFAFGTGDFTIEMWIYFNDVTSLQCFYDPRPSGTQGAYPALYVESGTLRFNSNTTDLITTPVSTGQWYHIAVSRSGSTTRMFKDGVSVGTYGSLITYLNGGAGRPGIGGGGYSTSTFFLNGYIDDLRITKGVARYTANFTPPGGPFPVY